MNVNREIAGLRRTTESGSLQREATTYLWLELPGYRDGRRDARRGVPEEKRLETLSALTELRKGEISGRCSVVRAQLSKCREQSAEIEARLRVRLGELPAAVRPVWFGLMLIVCIAVLVATEASLIHDIGNAWGIGSPLHQYLIALTLILVPALFLELLDSGQGLRGRITGHRLFLPVGLVLTLAMVLAVAWFRFAHMAAVSADLSERLPAFLNENGTAVKLVLMVLNTVFTLMALGSLGEIEQSLRAGNLRRGLRRIVRKREEMDRQQAVLEEVSKAGLARVAHLDQALRASYRHGRLVGEKSLNSGGRLRAALAAIGAVVLAILLSSCATSPSPGVAILLDVSQSVEATDNELATAALDLVGVLPRCAGVSIAPINARAGSIISERIPCEAAPYNDDLKGIYERVFVALQRSLPAWRALGGGSDYHGSLRLASQTLDVHKARYLVVLGDMVDNRGLGKRSILPPNVPLMNLKFQDTRVYVGFLASPIIDRLSDVDRAKFEDNWKALLTKAGAIEVDVRPFGVQGVHAWAARMFPEPSPVYEKWRLKKGGKK